MGGVEAQTESLLSSCGLDVAGRVASAMVSTVSSIIGTGGGGLSLQTSSMKLQWCRSSLIVRLLSCLFITSIDQITKPMR